MHITLETNMLFCNYVCKKHDQNIQICNLVHIRAFTRPVSKTLLKWKDFQRF